MPRTGFAPGTEAGPRAAVRPTAGRARRTCWDLGDFSVRQTLTVSVRLEELQSPGAAGSSAEQNLTRVCWEPDPWCVRGFPSAAPHAGGSSPFSAPVFLLCGLAARTLSLSPLPSSQLHLLSSAFAHPSIPVRVRFQICVTVPWAEMALRALRGTAGWSPADPCVSSCLASFPASSCGTQGDLVFLLRPLAAPSRDLFMRSGDWADSSFVDVSSNSLPISKEWISVLCCLMGAFLNSI